VAIKLGGGDGEIAERRSRPWFVSVVRVERGLEHDGLEPAAQRVGSQCGGGWRRVKVLDGKGRSLTERLGDPHRRANRPVVLRVEECPDPADDVPSLHLADCTTGMWYASGRLAQARGPLVELPHRCVQVVGVEHHVRGIEAVLVHLDD